MKNIFAGLIVLGALILSTCGYGQMGMMQGDGMMNGGMMNMSMIRYRFVMRNGINEKYADKVNPLQITVNNVKDGKKLYEQNCANCHGTSGQGDGDAGKYLIPRPANITISSKMPMATDGYLSWTIAEGEFRYKRQCRHLQTFLKRTIFGK